MIIRFLNKYLSIDSFEPAELPDLSVLTGLNGAGKSHLLTALARGNVTIDDYVTSDMVLFSNSNFKIGGEEDFSGQQIASEAQGAWAYFSQQMQPHFNSQMQMFPLPSSLIDRPSSFDAAMWRLSKFIDNNQQMKLQPTTSGIVSTLRRLAIDLNEIDEKRFVRAYRPVDTSLGALPRSIGKVFMDYKQKQITNSLIKVEKETLDIDDVWLSPSEFEAVHGKAPWHIINGILSSFSSIDYEVTNPERVRFHEKFKLLLKSKKDPDIQINFEDLSSGEKILMALVALVYNKSLSEKFPKVVLLDEIDASLHPSMTRGMISVINEVFISRGTKVIMVTHSPSTIALVPEESIFVVNRTGANKLEKRTRSDALSILTEGFATLEEGLVVFDRSNLADISIISEGYNTIYIKEALKHSHLEDVQVVENLEGMSGKNSLHTLFEFFCRVKHRAKIVFVWDCDANEMRRLTAGEDTIPFVFAKNPDNTFIPGGIENLLPMTLCEEFSETVTVKSRFKDRESKEFDGDKVGIANAVKARSNPSDLAKFEPLMDLIRSLKAPTATTST